MALANSMAHPLQKTTSMLAKMAPDSSSASPHPDADARRIAAAVAGGDPIAFEELYDRYHERLWRLVVVMTRGDETLAQEVEQSVMLTAASKLKPVESEEHLWHWLARVARQHLSKAWRQQRRESILITANQLPDSAEVIEPDTFLEQGLDKALLELDEGDREVIEWCYFDGLSHKAIAERLETTPKAVSSRLERARTKLRSSLKRILSYES